ncbi:hypothetical protein [Gluconobacter sp. P5E10]|uniref:hypothetical protein n=1 Tax=Gluconobacter sp. P5E10 TaxID=2762613 RepID=UPI001C051122|nr:hypothetical protein [Gluconobacter sp. P5E10]
MPELKADFISDWLGHMRSYLIGKNKKVKGKIDALDDSDVAVQYFETRNRSVTCVPRTIKIAREFSCPTEYVHGWEVLQAKVKTGADINGHLGRKHASPFDPDWMLAEWGVHHFHLGVDSHPNDPAFVVRSGPLVFAMLTDDTFYAINVYSHQSFLDAGVVEKIHDNWPEIISSFRTGAGVANVVDHKERKISRESHLNTTTVITDGTRYRPIGGGVLMSGVTLGAAYTADYWRFKVEAFQTDFQTRSGELVPMLMERGYSGEGPFEATLKYFSENEAHVFFPQYDLIAIVNLVASR